jgi:two-component system chemotaxis sensor kinase CheA
MEVVSAIDGETASIIRKTKGGKTIMTEANTAEKRESSNLRVSLGLLDNLMNLAGELVLGRNQLIQALSVDDLKTLHLTSQRIDLVTSELQEGIMKTRMQPVGTVFDTFPRIVRDLANGQGKKADLVVDGREVELDKTIIESIGDPLTRLVRHAVATGIEPPDERKQNGKPKTGRIYLKAYHEAGQVNIEISDDGRGLNPDRLGVAATERGLITISQLDAMSVKEKLDLIFLPEFAMQQAVQEDSGGSAGMDEVKTELEKLGGVIDITSRIGRGTTFRIKLPLTLAIIPSQIVSVGGEHYAIPQVNLDELLRIPAKQVKDKVEKVGNATVTRLRGKLLPLLRLAHVLGVQHYYTDPEDGKPRLDRRMNVADRRSTRIAIDGVTEPRRDEVDCPVEADKRSGADRRYHAAGSLNIAVVSAGSLTYGLIVDQMHDPEEIVVKPLGRHLIDCSGYAGATIMGDGRVALILDVYNLAKKARLSLTDKMIRTSRSDAHMSRTATQEAITRRWLCFRIAEDEHFAIDMECVQRIERVKSEAIEHVGGKQVIQNRDGNMPLLSLDDIATIKPRTEMAFAEVITVRAAGREVGLLATPPVDAVEVSTGIDNTTLRQDCILGSTIVKDKTTLIVDIDAAVEKSYPEWFDPDKAA